ncbi:uroporphyrinogen-III C-methyltransferase [Nakamurella alba]|uniref:uroporphyrinogen-III C-methyltransferase n=1 Tax=Nakamurella alba TaxID=2665158 RepID=UPI002AC325F0|nr:uroporphyrinogen-III C-methyltransferase [Nakamurella alba]
MGRHQQQDGSTVPAGGEIGGSTGTGTLTVDLPVRGRPVLVAGGGPPALGRIAALRAAGALVTVVSTHPADAVTDLADRGLITLHRREITDADLREALLVVTATGDPELDAGLAEAAERAGRLTLSGSGAVAVEPAVERRVSGGRVVLVGGGPGDPGLITVAGMAAVAEADVLVVDRLAPLAVLQRARDGAQIIDVSKIPHGPSTSQDEINRLLVTHARAGRTVVRLKGGDNFVFGRGGEEWQACEAAGIDVRIVPGVSSATAAPALAGIPVTHRTLNQGYTVVTAHVPPGDPRSTLDWAALARTGTALVLMMGLKTLPEVCSTLIGHGLDPATPAATVADAGLPSQRRVVGTVADIADRTREAGLKAPAVTVIGSVAAFDPRRTD